MSSSFEVFKSEAGTNFRLGRCGTSIDEKKIRRLISNRESAKRSRIRKQKHLVDLANEKTLLETKLQSHLEEYSTVTQRHSALEAENNVLMVEKTRLTLYLKNLRLLLKNYRKPDHTWKLEVGSLPFYG